MSFTAMKWARERIVALDLSPTAAHVLVELAWRHHQETGRCDPAVTAIAEGTKLADRTIRKALRELEQARVIRTMHRKMRAGGKPRDLTNSYTFVGLRPPAPDAGTPLHQMQGIGIDPRASRTTLPAAIYDLISTDDDWESGR